MDSELSTHLVGLQECFRGMIDELEAASKTANKSEAYQNELITVQDAAEQMSSSVEFIYNRIRRKTNPLPAFKDGSFTRIRRGALDEWIRKNEENAGGAAATD